MNHYGMSLYSSHVVLVRSSPDATSLALNLPRILKVTQVWQESKQFWLNPVLFCALFFCFRPTFWIYTQQAPLEKLQSQGCSLGVHDVQHIEKAEHIANSNQMTGDVLIYDDFIHRYFVSSFIFSTQRGAWGETEGEVQVRSSRRSNSWIKCCAVIMATRSRSRDQDPIMQSENVNRRKNTCESRITDNFW